MSLYLLTTTCPSESGQTVLEKWKQGSGSTCFSATLIIHRKCRLGIMGVKCVWVKKEGGEGWKHWCKQTNKQTNNKQSWFPSLHTLQGTNRHPG